jgi:hypothetical protein
MDVIIIAKKKSRIWDVPTLADLRLVDRREAMYLKCWISATLLL